MEDNQIVELYWQRSERALEETNAKYGAYCYAVAQRILEDGGEAEECVNDVWLRAWEAIPPSRPDCLRLFLARIARNLALDRYRRRQAGKRGGGAVQVALDELRECASGTDTAAEACQAHELKESVERFLRTLPARERNLFLRRYFFVDPLAEIAASYGLSENHAAVILSRTRKKLKAHLDREGYRI